MTIKVKLSQVCHERTRAFTSVASINKISKNQDLLEWWLILGATQTVVSVRLYWESSYGQMSQGQRLQEVSKIECRVPKNVFRRGQRLMIIEIQWSQQTTCRESNHRVSRTHMLLGHRANSRKDYGGCLHEGNGDGTMNMRQEHIQSVTWPWLMKA